MPLQDALLAALEHTRGVERAFLSGLTDAERRAAGAANDWSAKDLLAHLVDWRMRAAADLRLVAQGKSPEDITEFDPVNEVVYQRHKDKTWEELVRMSETAWADLASALKELPEDRWTAPSDLPSMNGRPWWRYAQIEVATHPVQHMSGHAAAHGRSNEASGWQEGNAARLEGLDAAPAWHGVVRYNLACHYAQVGDGARGIETLRAALQLNPGLKQWSREDPDLEPLRKIPGYEAIYNQ
jgi:hypothetical protein